MTTLNNTIVAKSPSGGDVDNGGFLTGSHNLIEDGSGGLTGTIMADPKLGPLQNNGGPTPTMALLAVSPAIDAGSVTVGGVTVPATDQRGAARPGRAQRRGQRRYRRLRGVLVVPGHQYRR